VLCNFSRLVDEKDKPQQSMTINDTSTGAIISGHGITGALISQRVALGVTKTACG